MAGLIDKMVIGLNKGVNTVSENSKIIVEKARLNTQLQDIERDKQRIFQTMGKLIYNLQSSEEIHITQCEKMCNEISELDRQILTIQEQLKAYEGTRLSSSNESPLTDGVQCRYCGFINSKEAKFCAHCGKMME